MFPRFLDVIAKVKIKNKRQIHIFWKWPINIQTVKMAIDFYFNLKMSVCENITVGKSSHNSPVQDEEVCNHNHPSIVSFSL